MQTNSRRAFLRRGGLIAAGAAAARWAAPAVQAAGANDRLRIGVLGCSRGLLLAKEFAKLGVEVAMLCDPDEARLAKAQKLIKAGQAVADMRQIFDDRSIDLVAIAAPDHWHAPATLLALAAGKHVYVEKPCSHNIREGRMMIEAARRSKLVVQVGSQSHSTQALAEGIQLIHEGAIGEVLVAKTWTCQKRVNIKHEKPSPPPENFDYDLWVGPAPKPAFQTNCHHYTWHWWYNFGTGDAGNRGVHEMDIALWGLNIDTHPTRVTGHGSKLFFDDDQQFPDTQYITFEYPPQGQTGRRLLIYEQRIWSPSLQDGQGDGNAFYGTEGYMVLSKHNGWKLFKGPKCELVKEQTGLYSVPEHAANFLAAVRSGGRPSVDIEVGHRGAVLAHLANIVARTGAGSLDFDPQTEQILNNPAAAALLGRTYRPGHWATPSMSPSPAGRGLG